MNRFAVQSTPSPAQQINPAGLTWLWILAAGVFYLLPWMTGPASSLTLGAYDLAEWVSLHPSVRFVEPFLLVTLILRLLPVLIAIIIGLNSVRRFSRIWWLSTLAVLLIAVALLPPLEFFLEARGDINYQQQFVVAVAALIGGLIGLTGFLRHLHDLLTALLALAAAIVAVVGMAQVLPILDNLALNAAVGPGMIGFTGVMLVLAGVSVWQFYERVQHRRIKMG